VGQWRWHIYWPTVSTAICQRSLRTFKGGFRENRGRGGPTSNIGAAEGNTTDKENKSSHTVHL
jgi:hypothetical protein